MPAAQAPGEQESAWHRYPADGTLMHRNPAGQACRSAWSHARPATDRKDRGNESQRSSDRLIEKSRRREKREREIVSRHSLADRLSRERERASNQAIKEGREASCLLSILLSLSSGLSPLIKISSRFGSRERESKESQVKGKESRRRESGKALFAAASFTGNQVIRLTGGDQRRRLLQLQQEQERRCDDDDCSLHD